MGFVATQPNSSSLRIQTPDDIAPRAEQFCEIAAQYGLRVLPWHNLGSPDPMQDTDGGLLCASVFGWTGEEEWWHGLARRRMCPLADLCRYQTEPFWGNAGGPLQSRFPTPHLAKIDLSWLWEKTDVRGILTVPVHMQLGQVGLVAFVTDDADFDFDAVVDELTMPSRDFVTSYARISTSERRSSRCEPLSAREIDCLNWAFYGKTDREIADITGRSYATVRFYISSAATKLDTVNRAQTLAKAAALGYFAFNA